MTLGQRIAQKRKELGLSQEGLGEQLGVSRQAIYKWESDASLPEIGKLITLSRIFSVSVGWLLGAEEDSPLTVRGEVRTFNNRSGVGSRLVVSVFARELSQEDGEDENHLEISGALCKPPVLRTTPLGRTICDMILAANRRYGRADYLPCIAWGSLAYRCGAMEVGDRLALEGRLQSRVYTKEVDGRTEERTAFEVSVMSLTDGDTYAP